MSSKWSQRRKSKLTAAERRRLRLEAGPLFEEIATAERRLLEEQPDLYKVLAAMTPQELEALALQSK